MKFLLSYFLISFFSNFSQRDSYLFSNRERKHQEKGDFNPSGSSRLTGKIRAIIVDLIIVVSSQTNDVYV